MDDLAWAHEQHTRHAMFASTRSSLVLPWERSSILFPPNVFGKVPLIKGPAPLAPDAAVVRDAERTKGLRAFDECGLSFKRRKVEDNSRNWSDALSESRKLALLKWMRIVQREPMAFSFCRQFAISSEAGLAGNSLDKSLKDLLSTKATATLNTRSGPVMRYIRFCDQFGIRPFPYTEASLYAFLEVVGESASPSFGRSFLCSVAFCIHVIGMPTSVCVMSQRVSGLAAKYFMNKRKLRQKPPLLTEHVMFLEEIVLGLRNKGAVDRVAAGFFCFLVYARARFSDGQASGNLTLDIASGDSPVGYIQADITRSKSSMSLERKTRFLPIVAPIRGLHKQPWATAWWDAIAESGLPIGAGKPLLPSPGFETGWGQVPLTAEAAASWLRALLVGCGVDRAVVMEYGTHSCKATALSWCSKAGLDRTTRATLGYHQKGRNGTELIYGRDNIAAPLRELERVIRAIRTGRFDPDDTRSGRWKPDRSERPSSVPGERVYEVLTSSSEDSADEDMPEHEEIEVAADHVVGMLRENAANLEAEELWILFRHGLSRVLHRVQDESGDRFKCGREVSRAYDRLDKVPLVLQPQCKQCFGSR